MQPSNTPEVSHTKAADAHDSAAQIHRAAARCHHDGDNKTGLKNADKALEASNAAHGCCQDAHAKSKSAAH
jgi:hypothetical protein